MPISTKRLPTPDQQARFLALVVAGAQCWIWTGKQNGTGYGIVIIDQKRVLAHRRSYELFVGPIPPGMMVLHSCDTRCCVNPNHLRAGNATENAADMADRGRAHKSGVTHCAQKHEFTTENTRWSMQRGRKRRHCRTCDRAARRRHAGFTGAGRWPQSSNTSALRLR